jgi:hypothetical protein
VRHSWEGFVLLGKKAVLGTLQAKPPEGIDPVGTDDVATTRLSPQDKNL